MTKYISYALSDWFELKRKRASNFSGSRFRIKEDMKKKRDLEAFLRYFKKSLWMFKLRNCTNLVEVRFLENSRQKERLCKSQEWRGNMNLKKNFILTCIFLRIFANEVQEAGAFYWDRGRILITLSLNVKNICQRKVALTFSPNIYIYTDV